MDSKLPFQLHYHSTTSYRFQFCNFKEFATVAHCSYGSTQVQIGWFLSSSKEFMVARRVSVVLRAVSWHSQHTHYNWWPFAQFSLTFPAKIILLWLAVCIWLFQDDSCGSGGAFQVLVPLVHKAYPKFITECPVGSCLYRDFGFRVWPSIFHQGKDWL